MRTYAVALTSNLLKGQKPQRALRVYPGDSGMCEGSTDAVATSASGGIFVLFVTNGKVTAAANPATIREPRIREALDKLR
ncbi:MAG: hypothetical protein JWM94_225 [Sphingomonas bacterium]|nr:hypothetical protein [Sphingomonas bacterium]